MPQSEGPPADDALPKLTFGQRVLASLPNLQAKDRTNGATSATNGVVRPDAVISPGRARTSGAARAGAAANPYADLSADELRESMKYLDDRERRYALFVGPLIAALDLAITFVTIHNDPRVGHKGHFEPSTQLGLGIGSAVIALLVVLAAYRRRRSFTLFALLFAGYGGGIVTMIPSWFVAGWLFVHFNRMQKALITKTGGATANREAAAKARAERQAARRRGRKKEPEPSGPSPNKRYTPPRPAPGR